MWDILVKFRSSSINFPFGRIHILVSGQFQKVSKCTQYLLIVKLKAENGLTAETSFRAVLNNFLIHQLELLINSVQCESKPLQFVVIFVKYMGNLLTLYKVLAHFFKLSASLKLNKSTKTNGNKIDGVLVKGPKIVYNPAL